MTQKPTIGIVGPGKVGTTLVRLWAQAGFPVVAVYSRSIARAEWLAAYVNGEAVATPAEVVARADLTLLTVPDGVIGPLAGSLAGDMTGKAVIHTSGAHDRHILDVLAVRGAITGSLHPAFPFADVETAIANLPGAAFAVEAEDARLRDWLHNLVRAVDGKFIDVPEGSKAVYHAALVIASNYTVTLYAAAERLLTGLGADRAAADAALNALMQATMANLVAQGIPDALTGPLTRSDTGTIAAHLEALHIDPQIRAIYPALARLTYPLLAARGVDTTMIDETLRQYDDPANHP